MSALSPAKRLKVGPKDHGRRMSLADFEFAEVQEGYIYELGRGIITVSDVPGTPHFLQVDAIRAQLYAYRSRNPGQIHVIAAGSECKLLVLDLESERHPDLSIYKQRPPRVKNVWRRWIPEIVLEVVSRRSRKRDYEEKREEYLRLGVKEYWIFDLAIQELLVLQRCRGRWTEKRIQPPATYQTRLLPGFKLDCNAVFQAAEQAGE